jgi:hypothetical protein
MRISRRNFPPGNGHLGAMVSGSIDLERIAFPSCCSRDGMRKRARSANNQHDRTKMRAIMGF